MIFRRLKHSSFLTIVIILLYSFGFLFTPLILADRVYAEESISKNDLYKGIGIAVLLIMISKLGQSTESSVEVDLPNSGNTRHGGDDVTMLARAIHAEARGEPYLGQVAVGAVVLNRVKSSSFPNSIKEVVFQRGQFSSVDDGQIYYNPGDRSYKAARDALSGRDPSYGALYFYNPKTAKTLWWLSTRKKTRTIGNHVFAK